VDQRDHAKYKNKKNSYDANKTQTALQYDASEWSYFPKDGEEYSEEILRHKRDIPQTL